MESDQTVCPTDEVVDSGGIRVFLLCSQESGRFSV